MHRASVPRRCLVLGRSRKFKLITLIYFVEWSKVIVVKWREIEITLGCVDARLHTTIRLIVFQCKVQVTTCGKQLATDPICNCNKTCKEMGGVTAVMPVIRGPFSRRSLRSSFDNMCAAPHTHNSFGDRSFGNWSCRSANLEIGIICLAACEHLTSVTNSLKHYWRHICLTRPRRLVTLKSFRNILTYLLTYLLTYQAADTIESADTID